jgi:hypothetical protein
MQCNDNIKMDLEETVWQDTNLIHPAHNTDQWPVPVSTVLSFLVLQKTGNFLPSERLLGSDGLQTVSYVKRQEINSKGKHL